MGETFDRHSEESRWTKNAQSSALGTNKQPSAVSTIASKAITLNSVASVPPPPPIFRTATMAPKQLGPIQKQSDERVDCIDLCGSPEPPKRKKLSQSISEEPRPIAAKKGTFFGE